VIPQPGCTRNETPIFVHSVAATSGKYFDRRMTIRRTWGAEALAQDGEDQGQRFRVIFVMGVPFSLTGDANQTEAALRDEAAQFGDILQFRFIENYYNLTLKAIAELKWAWRHCNNSAVLLKVDDDVLVNVPMLASLIRSGGIRSGLTGRVMTSPANRQVGHKW